MSANVRIAALFVLCSASAYLSIQHLLLPAFLLVRPTQNLTGVTGLGVTCLALVLWNLCQLLNPLDGDTLSGGVETLIKSRETVKFAR